MKENIQRQTMAKGRDNRKKIYHADVDEIHKSIK